MLFFGYASREDSGETSQYDQIMQKKITDQSLWYHVEETLEHL